MSSGFTWLHKNDKGLKHFKITEELRIAVKSRNVAEVNRLLIEGKQLINFLYPGDDKGNTLLHMAVTNESLEIVYLLLKNGARVNIKNYEEETPLHIAVNHTSFELVEKLLEYGADMNAYNKNGYTPFHIAASKGYKQIIDTMLDRGVDIECKTKNSEADNDSPLHLAANHCNCILAEALLDRKANANEKNDSGRTPLHLAVKQVDVIMAELLSERGACINTADKKGVTPLHIAANQWNCKILKMLLDRGSLLNSQNWYGDTPLHIAANNSDLTIVNMLLDRGALTDPLNSKYQTPLYYAVRKDHRKLVQKLVSKGASVDVLDDVETLLDDCPMTKNVLLPYVVKLKLAGLFKKPLQRDYSDIQLMCEKELQHIKLTPFYFIFLQDKFNKYFEQFDANKFKQLEEAMSNPAFDTAFPQYAFIFKVLLLKAKKRCYYLKRAQTFFAILSKIDNPYGKIIDFPIFIRRNILGNLSNVDLQNMIVCTENIYRDIILTSSINKQCS